MEVFDTLQDWAKANETLLWWLVGGTLAMLALTPVAVGWTLIRLPKDYFTKERRPLESWSDTPALRYLLLALKNIVGYLLVVAGLVMLLVPGQGLLTIVVGVVLIDFPGKFQLQRWIVTRGRVWRTINWLRKRAKREPLTRPK
jgi:hypothetical protein